MTAVTGSGAASEARGTVHQLASWQPRPSEAELTSWVGMIVFLAGWTMLFAGLFFAYGLVRTHAGAWPPADQPRLPRLLPGLATLLLVASSLAADRGLAVSRQVAGPRAARRLALAAALGTSFLALQLVVWIGLWRAGLTPAGGPYPSVFYGLTAIHALHVLVGLVALGWLAVRAWRRGAPRLQLRLWGAYWHFVGVAWLAMFVSVYLV
jgi:cytochrome c oxidase subunit III